MIYSDTDLYCYTFHPTCDEVPGLALKDKATRIFLNTHGTNSQDVNPELIELLKYMEHTNEAVSKNCASEKIHDIQRRIQAIKSSEEIGVKYMQAWEERILEQNKAREEGLARGRSEGQLQERERIKPFIFPAHQGKSGQMRLLAQPKTRIFLTLFTRSFIYNNQTIRDISRRHPLVTAAKKRGESHSFECFLLFCFSAFFCP